VDLSMDRKYEAYRDQVREFLAEHWVADTRSDSRPQEHKVHRFLEAAAEAGYIYRNIPRKYGGGERPADAIEGRIIKDEFARVGAPTDVTGLGRLVIPALLTYGTEAQRLRFVRATILGDIRWCQGFSEPGAGSDLASVSTKGRLVNGEWVIDGQKIWTSYAHTAHYMFALVRTEPEAQKHLGISYLLIEMNQPGIVVRPLRQVTGEANFNEVFLTGAKTPADMIVGGRGEGWKVKSATLKAERTGSAGEPSMALFRRILSLAKHRERFGRPALTDPEVRQWLVNLEASALAHLYSGHRMLAREAKGEDPGLFPLMNKLYSTEYFGMEAARIARELIGDDGLLLAPPRGVSDWPRSERPVGDETWNSTALTLLSNLIAGGTSNIQRNIISERGYGLPRDAGE
jgi:alkylation response protein AidB-like acyl-CoA dehydrogenase